MRFETAIKLYCKKYNEAVTNEYIRKPVSWALYYTWREIDAKEKPQKTKEHEEMKEILKLNDADVRAIIAQYFAVPIKKSG